MFDIRKARGLGLALVAASALAACETPEPVAPPPPPAPPPPLAAVALNEGLAQSAAVYIAFIREARAIPPGGFESAASIQDNLRRGASYNYEQIGRGLIAYSAIIALQSPEFVQGVRGLAPTPEARNALLANLAADPGYASTLPGAASAAGLIVDTVGQDATALLNIANAIEADAYTIQERRDPRRSWAVVHISNRDERLQTAKALSGATYNPSMEESAALYAAANSGSGLAVTGNPSPGAKTAVVNRALTIAALAALGAAGEDVRGDNDLWTTDPNAQFCLQMSKLMLYQCLAASRPSYEDMFCLGRHIMNDLATCVSQSLSPGPVTIPSEPLPQSDPQPAPTPAN